MLGVDPSARGMHLGAALTLAGLRHLRDRGLRQVMLYVEADNDAAVRVYRDLGFTRWDTRRLVRPLPIVTGSSCTPRRSPRSSRVHSRSPIGATSTGRLASDRRCGHPEPRLTRSATEDDT